jgi:hypothetical protein
MRPGVSALEFLGVLAALAGGVAIGSIYLGLDVKAAATRLLDRKAAPKAVESAAPVTTETAAPQAALATPATQIESIQSSNEETAETRAEDEPQAVTPSALPLINALELTEQQRREVTRTYWEALNRCMKKEVESRTVGVKASGSWELYDYLQARSEGHHVAATAIAELNNSGVDSHVLAYGEKALAWNQEGAKLYARAKDLLTDAPTAQLSGPFAQSWQSAATQHQMEERLLEEKRSAVQSYLEHQAKPSDQSTQ